MNRFAILKDIPPPPLSPFKDDIAKEIYETISNFTSVSNQPDRNGLPQLKTFAWNLHMTQTGQVFDSGLGRPL